MIVAVTGGRDYTNRERVFAALDQAHERYGVVLLMYGAARGADSLAKEWADDRLVASMPFEADWKNLDAPGAKVVEGPFGKYNVLAGFARNQDMATELGRLRDHGKPTMLVVFPGNRGTRDMRNRCRELGLRIWDPVSGEPLDLPIYGPGGLR